LQPPTGAENSAHGYAIGETMSAVFGDDQSGSTATHPSVARGHDVTGTRTYRRAVHDSCFIPPVVLDGRLS